MLLGKIVVERRGTNFYKDFDLSEFMFSPIYHNLSSFCFHANPKCLGLNEVKPWKSLVFLVEFLQNNNFHFHSRQMLN